MNHDVDIKVITLIKNSLGAADVAFDEQSDLLNDLGFNSISWMSLITDLEKEFKIEFDEEFLLFEKLRTVSSIISCISQILGRKHIG